MSEADQATSANPAVESTTVQMTDGRTVVFKGKRKVLKETIIDTSKIVVEGDVAQFQAGAVKVRMDFINGETRSLEIPLALMAKFAGHGGEQKFGDELASTKDKPLSAEDCVLAIDDLYTQISKGDWGRARESGGGGVSGAHAVVQAICEATGRDLATVKAFLQKKLDSTPGLTRRALYESFRAEGTATAAIIKRLEANKVVKESKVDASAALSELGEAMM